VRRQASVWEKRRYSCECRSSNRLDASSISPSLTTDSIKTRPNHLITFLRKDYLRPHEACFQVPLRFTKFDLRDYLWNLYNVEVTKVRSYVKERPLTQRRHSQGMYRPKPLKMMTVELSKPFQWPEAPTELEPWSNELFVNREKMEEKRMDSEYQRQTGKIPLVSKQPVDKGRRDLANLAKQMLSGEVKWSNDVVLDPKWDKILAAAGEKTKTEPKLAPTPTASKDAAAKEPTESQAKPS
jgi:large subunit ribosomal protein L23